MVWICYSQRRITINLQSIHTNIPAEVKEYQGAVSTTRMHLSCSIRDPPSNQTLAHGPRYARDTNTISSAFIPPASLALKRDYDLKSSFHTPSKAVSCPTTRHFYVRLGLKAQTTLTGCSPHVWFDSASLVIDYKTFSHNPPLGPDPVVTAPNNRRFFGRICDLKSD